MTEQERPAPPVLTPEQVEQLRAWHDGETWPWDCAAASEGQLCCIDELLDAQDT